MLQSRGASLKTINRGHIPSCHVSQVTEKVLKPEEQKMSRKGGLRSSCSEELGGSQDKSWLLTLQPWRLRHVAQTCSALGARGWQTLVIEGSSRWPQREEAKYPHSSTEQGCQLRLHFPFFFASISKGDMGTYSNCDEHYGNTASGFHSTTI